MFCTFGKIFEQGVAAIKNIYLWLHFLGCTLWPFITLIKNKLINNNIALIVLMRNFLYKSKAIILLILISVSIWAQAANKNNVAAQTANFINPLPVADTIIADTALTGASLKNYNTQQPDTNSVVKQGADTSVYTLFEHVFYYNTDTNIVEKWKYNTKIHELSIMVYDSTLNGFQNVNPVFKTAYTSTYIGYVGSASRSNLFFEQNPQTDCNFLQSFTPYLNNAHDVIYYRVRKPFTIFDVNIGPEDEQNVEVLHTQNISKYLNGFIKYNTHTGNGVYFNQKARNTSGVAGLSFIKNRFATHLNYTFGKISVNENGGITDSWYITDTILNTTEIPVRLTGGQTLITDKQLFFDQKVGFIKTHKPDSGKVGGYWFSAQYNYWQQKVFKIYSDKSGTYYNIIKGDTLSIYQNNYYNNLTGDSIYYTEKNHMLRINLEEVPGKYPFVGLYFGVGINLLEHSYNLLDTLDNQGSHTQKNAYFETGIYRQRNSGFKFSGNYKMYFLGYKQANFILDGSISQKLGRKATAHVVSANAELKSQNPDYFVSHYNSNHYKWDNNFKPINTVLLNGSYTIPLINTVAGVNYSVVGNYVYYNYQALPQQYNQPLTVIDAFLRTNLKVKRFGLNAKVDYQLSDNQTVMPLPDFSCYLALTYKQPVYFTLTEGKLIFQLGVDMLYHTAFYAPSYIPALNVFAAQNTQLVGNYPFVGAFVNVEIKRLRFFLRGAHANYRFTKANYFMAPFYPTPRFELRYGLAWTFYD